MVDFADTTEQAVWRAEVRQFVEDHLPRELADDQLYAGTLGGMHRGPLGKRRADLLKQWRQAILDRGWIAPAWPKEVGGADMSPVEQFILREVFTELHAPIMSVHDVGSTILVHGSEEQKQKYLPPMVRGEIQWCQGYSEPGAGSDLASVQTRGIRDGDDFVINGQKIWTSGAKTADMIFALVRTDPEAPKHRGISYLLFEMDKPGITVRPLAQMTDATMFNEVFFEDVRVPVSAAVGEINRGWYVGATHLDFERSSIGSAVGFANRLNDLIDFLKAEAAADTGRSNLRRSPVTRLALADRAVETTVARQFSNRIITMQARGIIPNTEASEQKLFSSELHQRTSNTAIKALGPYGMLYDEDDPRTPQRARWGTYYLATVSETIGAGTSEIQRNVIATRGLGLPRG
jgi:alkylation response protein AidB-like acyl-CoA dehydrogenase